MSLMRSARRLLAYDAPFAQRIHHAADNVEDGPVVTRIRAYVPGFVKALG